jgi:hypothetical protein
LKTKKQVTIQQFTKYVLPRMRKLFRIEAAYTKNINSPHTGLSAVAQQIEKQLNDFYGSNHIAFDADSGDALLRFVAALAGLRSRRAIATHDAHPAAFTNKLPSIQARPRRPYKRLRSSR